MPITVEPTDDHPVPYDTSDQQPGSVMEALAVAGGTAELQAALGAQFDDAEAAATVKEKLLEKVLETGNLAPLRQHSVAYAAKKFLEGYGASLGVEANTVRLALTNRLLEWAADADPKVSLKAIELLGKHSDIGLFTNRSEVTVNYRSPEELESAIRERVKRLLNARVIDVQSLPDDLDAELGSADLLGPGMEDEIFEPLVPPIPVEDSEDV